MKRLIAFFFVLILGFTASTDAWAWSRTGHMIAASIAYRSLPEDLQAEYTDWLRHHPDFDRWHADYASVTGGIPLGEYLFMRASVWPDEIRGRRNGPPSPYNHPTWHYTNFPLNKEAGFPVEPTLTPENDVLFGIPESERVMSSDTTSAVEKAAHLSWLLHLIGDLHQPLHAVALVNETYPNGDRGGNDFFIRVSADAPPFRLHGFWDGLFGRDDNSRLIHNEAIRLSALFPQDDLAELQETTTHGWAMESRALAIAHVYLEGNLEGRDRATQAEAVVAPEGYTKQAKEVAERQVTLAGYRLAQRLQAVVP